MGQPPLVHLCNYAQLCSVLAADSVVVNQAHNTSCGHRASGLPRGMGIRTGRRRRPRTECLLIPLAQCGRGARGEVQALPGYELAHYFHCNFDGDSAIAIIDMRSKSHIGTISPRDKALSGNLRKRISCLMMALEFYDCLYVAPARRRDRPAGSPESCRIPPYEVAYRRPLGRR